MFQPIYRCFKKALKRNHISTWISKELPDESINPPATSYNILAPLLSYVDVRPKIKFDGQYLKQEKVTFTHKNVLNIYIVYEINLWTHPQGADFKLVNSLFGGVKLTKNVYFDKHKYYGYGTGFDTGRSF